MYQFDAKPRSVTLGVLVGPSLINRNDFIQVGLSCYCNYMYLCQGGWFCRCLLATMCKNSQTDLHEIFRIRIGWNKFRQLVQLLTNMDISLFRRGRLHSSCMRSSMLHGSETWPVRKENEVALQRVEMRMVRWMCNVKVKDTVSCKELRERIGIDDIILILQQNRLR